MKLLLLVILCFSALTAAAQTDLPITGTVADVQAKTKYYLSAPTATHKWMLKELNKNKRLIRVNSPDDAEFFIEYKTTNPIKDTSTASGLLAGEEGQLDVYFMREGRKVIAYTQGGRGGWKGAPYITFTRAFRKEYERHE